MEFNGDAISGLELFSSSHTDTNLNPITDILFYVHYYDWYYKAEKWKKDYDDEHDE